MGQEVVLAQYGSSSNPTSFAYKNKIINGDMRLNQRYDLLGSTTTTAGYMCDRWNLQNNVSGGSYTNAQVADAPPGFTYSTKITINSALTVSYFNFVQFIEGFNYQDLAWGTSGAKSVTVSFWIKASVSGNYTFCMYDHTGTATRGYAAPYNVASSNTWQYVTITIPGDTSGSNWSQTNSSNSYCLSCAFILYNTATPTFTSAWGASPGFLAGSASFVGSSGATWQVTGVQVEVGPTATPYDYRSYGTELSLAQRYFYRQYGIAWTLGIINQASGSWTLTTITHPTTMRVAPTFGHNLTDAKRISGSPSANQWSVYNQNVGWGSISFSPASTFEGIFNGGGTTTQGAAGGYYTTFSAGSTHIRLGSNVYVEWAAEI